MGGLKPAWLTLAGYVRSEASDALPWRKVVLFNAEGFLDFYTQFLAEGFRRMGTECAVRTFNMPALETIRNNPSEMRSANIARIFDRQENLDELARILRREAGDAEAVLLPAVLGIDRRDAAAQLERPGRAVPWRWWPRCPRPSRDCRRSCSCGATSSSRAASTCWATPPCVTRPKAAASRRSTRPTTATSPSRPTATCSPRAAISVRDWWPGWTACANRCSGWTWPVPPTAAHGTSRDLFAAQPFELFGVKCDERLRGLRDGRAVENLYAIGAGLAGFNPVKEGCGAGVSMLTALAAAERILNE